MPNPAASIRANLPGLVVRAKQRTGVTFVHPDFPDDPRAGVWVGQPGPIHDEAGNDLDSGWVADTQGFEWRSVNLDQGTVLRARGDVNNSPWQVERLGESILVRPQGLYWVNDTDSLQPIASLPSGTTTPDAFDRLIWQDCFGAGLDLEMVGHISGRVEKRLHVDALASLPAPALSGTVWLDLWVGFTASSGLAPFVEGAPFSPRNNTTTVVSQIEWRTSTGETMGWFRAPVALDAEGNQLPATMLVRRQGPNLSARIRVPWSALQTAAYPVVIDPTWSTEVTGAANDNYARADISTWVTGSTNWYIGVASYGYQRYSEEVLLYNPDIDGGTTITDATLTCTLEFSNGFGTGEWCTRRFRAEASNDGSMPSTYAGYAGKSWTTAYVDNTVAYDSLGVLSVGDTLDFDVLGPVREVIEDETHGAWTALNSLVLNSFQTDVNGSAFLRAALYEHTTYNGPILTVEFISSGPPHVAVERSPYPPILAQ